MSTTMHVDVSSSPESTPSDPRSRLGRVWSTVRPYVSLGSVMLSVLSALYITAVTGGATSRAIDNVTAAQAQQKDKVAEMDTRMVRLEAVAPQIGVLTTAVLESVRRQSETTATVEGVSRNVNLLLDAILRGQVKPTPGAAP